MPFQNKSNDEYYDVFDGKGNQIQFMVCYQKNGIKIDSGFLYRNDIENIIKLFKKIGEIDRIPELDQTKMEI